MEISVHKYTGEDTGRKIDLSEAVFGVDPNDHAIYLDVKQYLANQRQGTHKAKEKAEITGSTKKLKKQKGTGTARAGSIKSPVFRGGGRIFGPKPRNYSFKLNRKLKQLARKSALSYKAQDNAILVLEDFNFEAPKTKEYIALLGALQVSDKKTLMVVGEDSNNVYLSSRNLRNAKVITVDRLTTYDVLHADNLLLCEGTVEKLSTILN
ncbi:MAG TPA: 50S ribosomal protein L4 [Cytophagales bacterium]|nr:50S ribosomal protein L4 [Cytophagales bacterium]HAA23112.1 50S ribosomal protein L4 [Cytophagales bacterium]HAP61727.1 50S ribosomal protein L4 [Cytophagales bacterium]